MFKNEWFRYYSELPEQMDEYLQSWDCTFKDTQTSDYVVGQVWARKGSYKYMVYQIRKRMDFVETMQEIIKTSHMYPKAYRKLIEDKANGSAVVDALKDHGVRHIDMPASPQKIWGIINGNRRMAAE